MQLTAQNESSAILEGKTSVRWMIITWNGRYCTTPAFVTRDKGTREWWRLTRKKSTPNEVMRQLYNLWMFLICDWMIEDSENYIWQNISSWAFLKKYAMPMGPKKALYFFFWSSITSSTWSWLHCLWKKAKNSAILNSVSRLFLTSSSKKRKRKRRTFGSVNVRNSSSARSGPLAH